MTTQDDNVMFQVGVMEHPLTKSRLEGLAASFNKYQKEMQKGIDAIGKSALSIKQSVSGVVDQIRVFRNETVAAASDIREALSKMGTVRIPNRIPIPTGGGSGSNDPVSGYTPPSSGPAPAPSPRPKAPPVEIPELVLPANLRNVFKELEGEANESADAIQQALTDAVSGLPTSVTAQTELLRREYQKRMVDQSAAYAAMAADLDGYLAKEGSTTDQISANMRKAQASLDGYAEKTKEANEKIQESSVKAVRAIVQGAKGFAEIGLMSEQNAQKFMQSMAMIQGAFDIFESGADLLEAFNKGWKAVGQATEAASKATKVQQALSGGQFAQLKAYQEQLQKEELAANRTTEANLRLSRSRGGAGGAAGSLAGGVASGVAEGAASKVASGAAKTTAAGVAKSVGKEAVGTAVSVGVGAMIGPVAGTIVSALAPAAAAMATIGGLLATVGASAVLVTESFTGAATKANSNTDMIVGAMSNFARVTSLWSKDQGSFLASLRQSNLETLKLQKLSDKTKIEQTAKDDVADAKRDAAKEHYEAKFKTYAEATRNNAGKIGGYDIAYSTESRIQATAQSKLAQEQKNIDDYQSGASTDKNAYSQSLKNAEALKKELQDSVAIQMQLTTSKGDQRLAGELELQQQLTEDLAKQKTIMGSKLATEKEQVDAAAKYSSIVEKMNSSLEKQRSIVKETASEQLATEMRKQDLLKSQLDLQTAQIQKIEDQYRSAAVGFAKLGDVEKSMAAEALQQAKTKGAASLEDYQKDLLRQIGSSEATRIANEGDMAEAKKYGFDQSFGGSIEQERKTVENARQTIEAQLKTSYDVAVNMQTNADDVANAVVEKVNRIREDERKYIEELIDTKLQGQVQVIRKNEAFAQAQLKANKG